VEQSLLIVVSGLPGSGKTTLARDIGTRLVVPVVERDRLAEVCFDALRAESAAGTDLGSVSYDLLFHVARLVMASRRPLALENNFSQAGRRRGRSRPVTRSCRSPSRTGRIR
jgi:predicted kinase